MLLLYYAFTYKRYKYTLMKILINVFVLLAVIYINEGAINTNMGLQAKVIDFEPADGSGCSLSSSITYNPDIEEEVLDEIISTKNEYVNTEICIECMKLISQNTVINEFYSDALKYLEKTIMKGTFLNFVAEYINPDFYDDSLLRRLVADKSRIFVFYSNNYNPKVMDCAENNKAYYTPNAQAIQNKVKDAYKNNN